MNKFIANKTDCINIALILTAYIIAFILPFELLVLSYAFLGPAHYLTQISWMHEHNYFTQSKNDYIYLCILVILLALMPKFYLPLMVITCAYAFITAFIPGNTLRILLLTISTIIAMYSDINGFQPLLIFIPTIIHVFCFTALFMLAGALRSSSALGYTALFVLLSCGFSFFVFDQLSLTVPYYQSQYSANNIKFLGGIVNNFTNTLTTNNMLNEPINALRFIAFAYCYHYLNWFSKVNIIGWQRPLHGKRKRPIIILYLMSIIAYTYDYELGFMILLILSFLHVVLELPLNFLTFRSVIGRI